MDGATDSAHSECPRIEPLSRTAYLVRIVPILAAMYAPVIWVRKVVYHNGIEPYLFGHELIDGPAGKWVGIVLGALLMAGTIAVGWLSARRTAATGGREGEVIASIVPWVQLIVIPVIALRRDDADFEERRRYPALRAALWGLALSVGAEIVSTLVFGVFGMTLFVAAPFFVGFVAAWIAVRDGDPHPLVMGQGALIVASLVLFGFAFEGLVCLVVIYPLAMIACLIGAGAGMMSARLRMRRATAMSSVALLPLMLAAELAEPPLARFSDVQSVEVAAPPEAVWDAIVHMGTIDRAPAAPFGWGLAYPVAGHIDGSGIGAIRRGVFSTGVAFERVTRWQPNRQLWFDVLSDPPMMVETNPFGPVRSAHLDGYFVTRTAHFTIQPTTTGHTRLTLATEHQLRIGPTTYFVPIARWAVDENKRRVLDHFRDRAQEAVRARQ